MFITPYFGGCKYTNYFLFINKNIEFQWLGMLITSDRHPPATSWQLLLRLLPNSLYSGSENKDKTMKTATAVQSFGHFSIRCSGNWCETRKTATTVQSFDRFSVQRSEGVDF